MAKLKEGDLVYIELEGWIDTPSGSPELFDTTREDLAKEHDLHDEKRVYGPSPMVLGQDRLMEGLEEGLVGAEVGEELEIVVPPEKGAGQRDPNLVELFPLREFHRQEIDPQPGMEVSIRNRTGTVTAVTAGRVRVDFNNPLAGKTLRYRVKVDRKVAGAQDQIRAILEMDYGPSDDFDIKVEKGVADIVLPDACKYDDRWFVNKYRVVADLRELAGLKTVRLIEEYAQREEAEETEEAEAEATAD